MQHDENGAMNRVHPVRRLELSGSARWACTFAVCACAAIGSAQSMQTGSTAGQSQEDMQERIQKLEGEVRELMAIVKQLQSGSVSPASGTTSISVMEDKMTSELENLVQPEDRKTLDLLRDTTINLGLDTYYAYNFNHPVGRVNLLRAYDVLSNEFSLNQASVIFEHGPDLSAGRRWGARLDLQFGQATDTLQGNPSNEPRPQIYRNVFQAYGSYIVPLGNGLTV